MVRAKFRLTEATAYDWAGNAQRLKFTAVCDDKTPENAAFAKFTPSGELSMLCNNPQALAKFTLGKEYYLDFHPVEDVEKT